MPPGKSIVIIGGTSRIAWHCARRWLEAEGPVRLTLVGRDAERTGRVAADLRVRRPDADIAVEAVDFHEPSSIRTLADHLVARRAPDLVLIAHGSLPDQSACQEDLALCRDTLMVNGVSPVLFAEAFAAHFERRGAGVLVLLGSVAGDRGRRSNYVYGSAKGLVTRYAQGLQHRFAGSGVRVVLVKPGPTDTPMTAEFKARGARLADPDRVAARIVTAAARGEAVVYAPPAWALVMWIIRHLPAFIFNRLKI